jgi:serine/threonine protein kinase, bacterial
MANFVCHPDGTVDYPDTGCYTMSAEEFAAADTRQAWSQAEPPPEPQPYYEPHHYEPTYHEPPHHDWMRVLKLVSGITAGALVIAAVIVLVTSLTKPVTPTNPARYPTATQTVTASALPTTATQTVTASALPTTATQTVTAIPAPVTVTPPLVTVTPPPAPPSPASVPTLPPGDLGLPTPMSHPKCNGGGIVVLGNVTTPGIYAAGVQNLLNAHPGASYLRTDQACPSLRQASDEGNPIYAVFKFAGTTQLEVCTAVRAAGGGAYGKWLDYSTDPAYIIPC